MLFTLFAMMLFATIATFALYLSQITLNKFDSRIIFISYRFILCKDARDENGDYHLSTTEIFTFSENLMGRR